MVVTTQGLVIQRLEKGGIVTLHPVVLFHLLRLMGEFTRNHTNGHMIGTLGEGDRSPAQESVDALENYPEMIGRDADLGVETVV